MAGISQEFEAGQSEYANPANVPDRQEVIIEYHRPTAFNRAYHHHASVEINFLQNCSMTYSFSGHEVAIPEGRFAVFWAAHPHRVVDVQGHGTTTNMYLTLSEFLQWSLPKEFVHSILAGQVLCSQDPSEHDCLLSERWARERTYSNPHWTRLHALEAQSRLYRMSHEGWDVLLDSSIDPRSTIAGGKSVFHFERMLRFIAENSSQPISIKDVADSASVSPNHAIALFRKLLRKTIKEYITDLRLSHAKMLLLETDSKILSVALDSGFGSLSSFYEVFQKRCGESPAAYRKSLTGR